MIITTKPVMGSLATIILCVLIGTANCVIKKPCTANRDNDFTCTLTNDPGEIQFQVKRGSQSNTMDIAVPNLKKDNLGHLKLNFTIVGASVGETSEYKDDLEWHLKLSDDQQGDPATMTVQHLDGVTLTSFLWPGRKSPSEEREVCIHLNKDQSWYNTFEQKIQRLPMDLTAEIGSFPLNSVPLDTNSEIGSIVEYLFLSSNGFAILLDRKTPVFLKIVPSASDTQLCFTSRNNAPYDTKNTVPSYTEIKFDIYTGANIHDVYDIVSNKQSSIPKPKEIPNDFMFVNPIWSIIAGKGKHFVTDVDLRQEKVVQFIQELKKKGYQNNMLLLETDWEVDTSYLTFNQAKFATPDKMMSAIHDAGYKLNLLVHPYVRAVDADKDYSVKSKSGSEAFLIKNGEYKDRYIVDFSNPKAKGWFKIKLDKLKVDSGVDSFVFNSIAFSNNSFSLATNSFAQTPAKLIEEYVNLASTYGGLTVVRDGHQTQDKHIYTQMSDRTSDWGYQKGLKSLIPTALALSIGGYSYILPDVVGGRSGQTPSKELYIRWAQATTFFPTMHFAIPPWDYDLDTENIVKDLVTVLRIKYKDLFVNLANKRMKDGTPMMRPMWFVAPEDERSYKVDDQFMLGDDLLVAPVLDEKADSRDVYFPKGKWADSNDKTFTGPGVESISAPIDVLPYFTRVK